MVKKITKPTDEVPSSVRLKRFFKDERTCFALGLILVVLSIYVFFSFASYVFTIDADQSQVEGAVQSASAKNLSGLKGAKFANLFINEAFGVSAFLLLIFPFVLGLRLMQIKTFSLWKSFLLPAIFLVWSSIFFSFFFYDFYKDSALSWGGAHGDFLSVWLFDNIGWGVVLLLFVSLVVILIFASSKTLPFIKKIFTFRRKVTPQEAENQKAIGTEIVPEEWVEDSAIEVDLSGNASPEEFQPIMPKEEVQEEEEKSDADELEIDIVKPEDVEVGSLDYVLKTQGKYDPTLDLSHYKFPSLSLLKTYPNENAPIVNMDEQNANKERIVNALGDFGIEITSIKATIGPTVTLYEIVPKAGTRISKIRNLESDIMLSLAAKGIRIIAPIPGKGTIGIEVPNENPQIVSMHSIIASKKFQEEEKMALPVAIGRTITNEVFMFDLAKTPHLLVAGATGQGKSVGLNAVITSLLYKKHPAELKFVLIDPKMVEFNIYAAIEKHYMAKLPEEENVIITDSTKVIQTLKSLVVEMENRFELLNKANCRNIIDYNEKFVNCQLNPEKGHRFLPYIVIVIDEFGDFIMVAGKEVEMPIARITQKGRAAGMHMILATQRPSVNIITGVIKANIPSRMAFRVQSMIDSRTILDATGAQQLIGRGDLLYSGGNDVTRVQCAFVDTPEVEDIVNHISKQQAYPSAYELPEPPEGGESDISGVASVDLSKRDVLFADVARWVVSQQIGSTSAIQRNFELGFNRAGKIMDQLEKAGIVGPQKGSKPRQVLVQDDFMLTQILESLI